MEKPVINNKYLLEKMSGKGGWTYALLPDIDRQKINHFGWIKVTGSIDDYELKSCNLAPMGNGKVFLPVKAEIRKAIGKQAGDWVQIKLFLNITPEITPEEILLCLEDEPKALDFFNKITDNERKHYIDWIYEAKMEPTKIDRIVKTIDRLSRGLKLYDSAK
jgi:Domain of unknown function (DUF1905)/Bacteriocin-protection, YdeI or OmpD-Associated